MLDTFRDFPCPKCHMMVFNYVVGTKDKIGFCQICDVPKRVQKFRRIGWNLVRLIKKLFGLNRNDSIKYAQKYHESSLS